MKKLLSSSILVFILVIAVTSMVLAKVNSGAIWTTKSDCGNESQDVNHYFVGEKVYINGENFAPDTYNWTITGQPGGASCDPETVIASGNHVVDSSGAFCFEAYTVNLNDCGEYDVDFNGKKDNYHVSPSVPLVPEFGAIVGALTILSAIGVFFVIRKR